ncbi:unnamed protein product [Zymoseptoria tritici ST99CH_1A5]|uniref:Uncharacterized protein n=1 Tax=Zymoseptoria tritici ST99CH_1A5 TaxID=1276529 RepID=A0A1Y6LZQ5_ZYMTR|nr:unnamed protein product [Zymoseptoria tritici ST99CH_1A5]
MKMSASTPQLPQPSKFHYYLEPDPYFIPLEKYHKSYWTIQCAIRGIKPCENAAPMRPWVVNFRGGEIRQHISNIRHILEDADSAGLEYDLRPKSLTAKLEEVSAAPRRSPDILGVRASKRLELNRTCQKMGLHHQAVAIPERFGKIWRYVVVGKVHDVVKEWVRMLETPARVEAEETKMEAVKKARRDRMEEWDEVRRQGRERVRSSIEEAEPVWTEADMGAGREQSTTNESCLDPEAHSHQLDADDELEVQRPVAAADWMQQSAEVRAALDLDRFLRGCATTAEMLAANSTLRDQIRDKCRTGGLVPLCMNITASTADHTSYEGLGLQVMIIGSCTLQISRLQDMVENRELPQSTRAVFDEARVQKEADERKQQVQEEANAAGERQWQEDAAARDRLVEIKEERRHLKEEASGLKAALRSRGCRTSKSP